MGKHFTEVEVKNVGLLIVVHNRCSKYPESCPSKIKLRVSRFERVRRFRHTLENINTKA